MANVVNGTIHQEMLKTGVMAEVVSVRRSLYKSLFNYIPSRTMNPDRYSHAFGLMIKKRDALHSRWCGMPPSRLFQTCGE